MTELEARAAVWTLPQRVLFRFLFSYVVLFFFPVPRGISDPDELAYIFEPFWSRLVPWFALHAFHLTVTSTKTGSGDTTYSYLRVLCMLLLALLATLIWSIADRRRQNYVALHAWSRIWFRYALAMCAIPYGVVKLFKGQFYDPSYNVLTTAIGEETPMRLLWTFMGVSKGYVFFAGLGEFVGGALLLFRRTTLLGSLILIGVIGNVVALNYCYDVCVKLGSTHLLFGLLLLAAPDLGRLAKLFLLNQPVPRDESGPQLKQRWMRIGARVLQAVLVCAIMIYEFRPYLKARPASSRPYAVRSFNQDGADIDAPAAIRWKSFKLYGNAGQLLVLSYGSTNWYAFKGNPETGPIALFESDPNGKPVETAPLGELRIAHLPADELSVDGMLKGHKVSARLFHPDVSQLPVYKTGFHWIQEEPNNEPR